MVKHMKFKDFSPANCSIRRDVSRSKSYGHVMQLDELNPGCHHRKGLYLSFES